MKENEFIALVKPVLDHDAAANFYRRMADREGLARLEAAAAFFRGEAGQPDMDTLTRDDWEAIRETLEDASGTMDLDTLTDLMGKLVERGILK